MDSKEDFNNYCETNLSNFTDYLSHINKLRNNINQNKFSSDEIKFFENHFELSILLVVSNLDNIVIIKNLNRVKVDWEIRFFIKKLYLNIYETFKSIDSYNKFIIDNFCVNEEIKNEYVFIKSKIKDFRKLYGYETEIKKVRNITAGHIHHSDFNLYFETLSNLNPRKSINMGIEFIGILNEFDQYLFKNLKYKSKVILKK